MCEPLADSVGAGDGLGAVDEVRRLPDTQDALLCILPTTLLSALPTTPLSPRPPLPVPSIVPLEHVTVSNVSKRQQRASRPHDSQTRTGKWQQSTSVSWSTPLNPKTQTLNHKRLAQHSLTVKRVF